MKKYILNPLYVLRHEVNCSFILSKPTYEQGARIHIIHPIYAMMLTFFRGEDLNTTLKNISDYFNMEVSDVEKIVSKLIENEYYVKNSQSVFPPKTLIEYTGLEKESKYSVENFNYDDIDLSFRRFSAPLEIVINLTMRCATSCIYCYADRAGNKGKHLPIEYLMNVLEEAKKIGIISVRLMGGEIFLYKEWKQLLTKMLELEYPMIISTKIPLKKDHLHYLKLNQEKNGFPVQISLDTLIKENLYKTLRVKDPYLKEIKESIVLLEKENIKYNIHTVLCRYNDTIQDIQSLESFLTNKKSIVGWDIDPSKCSMYNGLPYKVYKPRKENIEAIQSYLKDKTFNFKVKEPNLISNKSEIALDKKKESFMKRPPCSGNYSSLYILPDGKVTICEELYWHPRFILGDITKESLLEIWNSEKAHKLYYIQQSDFSDNSACKTCNDFESCRKYKHICWRDTIQAYGNDNWDFPDTMCEKAPPINKDIFT